jgi:hypothetical protein
MRFQTFLPFIGLIGLVFSGTTAVVQEDPIDISIISISYAAQGIADAIQAHNAENIYLQAAQNNLRAALDRNMQNVLKSKNIGLTEAVSLTDSLQYLEKALNSIDQAVVTRKGTLKARNAAPQVKNILEETKQRLEVVLTEFQGKVHIDARRVYEMFTSLFTDILAHAIKELS